MSDTQRVMNACESHDAKCVRAGTAPFAVDALSTILAASAALREAAERLAAQIEADARNRERADCSCALPYLDDLADEVRERIAAYDAAMKGEK